MLNAKLFLCSEFGERFYINAENIGQARLDASIYGAEVIAGPLAKKYEKINPATLNVVKGKIV
jgi:hypothetical protein